MKYLTVIILFLLTSSAYALKRPIESSQRMMRALEVTVDMTGTPTMAVSGPASNQVTFAAGSTGLAGHGLITFDNAFAAVPIVLFSSQTADCAVDSFTPAKGTIDFTFQAADSDGVGKNCAAQVLIIGSDVADKY